MRFEIFYRENNKLFMETIHAISWGHAEDIAKNKTSDQFVKVVRVIEEVDQETGERTNYENLN